MSKIEVRVATEEGREYIVPVSTLKGYRLDMRQEWWKAWQRLGLPLPDLTTGKVELVKRGK